MRCTRSLFFGRKKGSPESMDVEKEEEVATIKDYNYSTTPLGNLEVVNVDGLGRGPFSRSNDQSHGCCYG